MEKKVNAIVRIHHPQLTPEEYERRMAQIKRAAEELLIATERNKRWKQQSP